MNKAIPIVIAVVIAVGAVAAYLRGFASGSPVEEEVASVIADESMGPLGGVFRATVKNNGTVDVRLKKITAEVTEITGTRENRFEAALDLYNRLLRAGFTAEFDIPVTKGTPLPGEAGGWAKPGDKQVVILTIETDKGTFEQKISATCIRVKLWEAKTEYWKRV